MWYQQGTSEASELELDSPFAKAESAPPFGLGEAERESEEEGESEFEYSPFAAERGAPEPELEYEAEGERLWDAGENLLAGELEQSSGEAPGIWNEFLGEGASGFETSLEAPVDESAFAGEESFADESAWGGEYYESVGESVGEDEADEAEAYEEHEVIDHEAMPDLAAHGAWATMEAEGIAESAADVSSFITTIARLWEDKKGGSVAAREARLRADHADILQGAKARAKMLGTKEPDPAVVTRAWMIAREQQMKFETTATPVPKLSGFQLSDRPTLVVDKSISGSKDAPVAPLSVAFVKALRGHMKGISAWTYGRHGSAGFVDRGYSIDFGIGETRDDRGFFPRDKALAFFRAMHTAAAEVGAEWRAIYNDFSVADVINRETGRQRVIFVGTVFRDKSGTPRNLNFHGPHPLILHVHVDLVPRAGGPSTGPVTASGSTTRPTTAAKPSGAKAPSGDAIRFAQLVLTVTEGEHLGVDGDLGPRTAAAIDRFRQRHGLGHGGELDDTVGLALVQRALEELAQQSMFRIGTRDAATERELISFKARNGLLPLPTIDSSTLAALGNALQRRTSAPAAPAASSTTSAGALSRLAQLSSPSTTATVANALAITKIIAGHHGIPWRVCFTILAHEGGVRLVKHNDGVMQTTGDARKRVIGRIPVALMRALLGLPENDTNTASALEPRLQTAFHQRLAVQIAAGIQEIKENLALFNNYVALAYQAYNVGPGWSYYTVTRGASKGKPRGVTADAWETMCREGATLLHKGAGDVRVSAGYWQCDKNMPGWFRDYGVYDKQSGRQLIGYKYLRSFRGEYHANRPALACTIATHGAAHRQSGTGPLKQELTRKGSLDKLFDPALLGGDYATAVRAELQSITDDGSPLKIVGGSLVRVRPDGSTAQTEAEQEFFDGEAARTVGDPGKYAVIFDGYPSGRTDVEAVLASLPATTRTRFEQEILGSMVNAELSDGKRCVAVVIVGQADRQDDTAHFPTLEARRRSEWDASDDRTANAKIWLLGRFHDRLRQLGRTPPANFGRSVAVATVPTGAANPPSKTDRSKNRRVIFSLAKLPRG